MNMPKREQDKAIEDTKKVAEEAKSIEDKIDAVDSTRSWIPSNSTRTSEIIRRN